VSNAPTRPEFRAVEHAALEPFLKLSIYTSFFWEEAMSKTSDNLRHDAANELRKSLNGGSAAEKAENRKRAAAYTSLAENEDWLAGDDNDQPRREP
jgi:hypothetical protein